MKHFFKQRQVIWGIGFFSVCLLLLFILFDPFYESHFRSTETPIVHTENVDLSGFKELKASGSGPLSFAEIIKKLGSTDSPKIIVDAMAELHGYVKGTPTNFFAYQRQSPNIIHTLRRLIYTGKASIDPSLPTSEPVEAQKYGFDYHKVTIGSKFMAKDEHIDEIVSLFDSLPEGASVHFHCARGRGRTSMLLVMYDIMKNAPRVSLENIIKRHILLGSEDLFNTDVWKRETYSEKQLADRKNFLIQFYNFTCQRKQGKVQRWSEWKKQQV